MAASDALARVAEVLGYLDAALLERCRCYFAGGCRLAFELSAHRTSNDLDFLCSDPDGYRELRTVVHDAGHRGLFGANAPRVTLPREVRVDAYGVRFPVLVDNVAVRVEFVREARVMLHDPESFPWTQAPCLAVVDCYTEKLLANADRGADPDELFRDLVDLGALRRSHGAIPDEAWTAALAAYGPSVRVDLIRAATRYLGDDARRIESAARLEVREPDAIARGVELLLVEASSHPRE